MLEELYTTVGAPVEAAAAAAEATAHAAAEAAAAAAADPTGTSHGVACSPKPRRPSIGSA